LIADVTPMNPTLDKFGYPHTLLKEFKHWCILRRSSQATLGALILGSKHMATSLGSLPAEAHAELHVCTSTLERALTLFRPYDKINYLALMMLDPQVHFHVLPRYAHMQEFKGFVFPDSGWPGMPDLKAAPTLEEATQMSLHASLLDAFAQVV
jgi:diadenosine tetraphosphate (Ap4A) HIT family hydrolase